jgi:hypothetical protein
MSQRKDLNWNIRMKNPTGNFYSITLVSLDGEANGCSTPQRTRRKNAQGGKLKGYVWIWDSII